jgi:hypothetical protein
MTPKTYFSIFGVLSGLFGIGFVLAPAQVLIMYGIESTPAVALAARLCGGTLLAAAIGAGYLLAAGKAQQQAA